MADTENDQELPSFAALGITGVLGDAIAGLGWTAPTEIQANAIPAGLQGRDIIGLAETGVKGSYISVFLLFSNFMTCPTRLGKDWSICDPHSSRFAADATKALRSSLSSDKRARVSDK